MLLLYPNLAFVAFVWTVLTCGGLWLLQQRSEQQIPSDEDGWDYQPTDFEK